MDDPNGFLKKPDFWFLATMAAASVLFIGILIGTGITLFGGPLEAIGGRADVFYKLALIGAGLVTFCTVAWRGLLATEQLAAQREQLEKMSLQIAATDKENLVDLFHKGAELLDEEKPSSKLAGLATLQVVAESSDDKFARRAMDIIADYIQTLGLSAFETEIGNAARAALFAVCEATGRTAFRKLTFTSPTIRDVIDEVQPAEYEPIFGIDKVTYFGGIFRWDDLVPMLPGETTWRLVRSSVEYCTVDMKRVHFVQCEVKECRFVSFNPTRIGESTLRKCEFSGARVTSPQLLPDLRSGGNWYDPKNPPTSKTTSFDWKSVLLEGMPEGFPDEDDDEGVFYSNAP